MNNTKLILLSLCLLFGVSLHSQSRDTLSTKGSAFDFYLPKYTITQMAFDFKGLDLKKEVTLSLYNPTTNLYDTYDDEGSGYISIGSSPFFEDRSNFFTTLFLGNSTVLENHPQLQPPGFMLDGSPAYQVRDSFNPYGATNMRQALVGGFLGLLFN